MRNETIDETIDETITKQYTDWMVKTGGFARDMTMRDAFAIKASEEDIKKYIVGSKFSQAVDRGTGFSYTKSEEVHYTREQAKYRYADAILKERAK